MEKTTESPTRTYNILIAVDHGLSAAAVYGEILRWCEYNEQEEIGEVYLDGDYWMYTSRNRLHKHLPCLSIPTIRRALAKLVKVGLIHEKARTGTAADIGNPTAMLYRAVKKAYGQDGHRGDQNEPGGRDQIEPSELRKLERRNKSKSSRWRARASLYRDRPPPNSKAEQPATAEQVESVQNNPIRSAAKPTYHPISENIGRKKRKRRQIVEQPDRPPTASEQKQLEMLRVQARQITAKAAASGPVTDDDLPF